MPPSIGIITLYRGNYNYGGQLQAYALQKKAEQLGLSCEIIYCDMSGASAKLNRLLYLGFAKSCVTVYKKALLFFYRRIDRELSESIARREDEYRVFMEMIPRSDPCMINTVAKACGDYEAYIVGSDQVWNPGLFNGVLTLDFVRPGKRKIAYAASVGDTALSEKYLKRLSGRLESFHSISMREQSGAEIISALVKKEVATVLDPAMLFDRSFWDSIAVPPNIEEPYAIVYMPEPDELLMKKAVDFCRQRSLRMISFPHLQGKFSRIYIKYHDIQSYCGPCGFIGLIRDAACVFTNSFHAAAFSIIYHRPFIASYNRSQKDKRPRSSRIADLLSLLGLERQMISWEDLQRVDIETRICPINWRGTDERLDELRKRSEAFLKEALS